MHEEDMSSNTSTCVKIWAWYMPVSPALEGTDRWMQKAGSLAGQPSQNGKLKVQFETLSPKPRWRAIEEDSENPLVSTRAALCVNTWAHECVRSRARAHTQVFKR